MKIAERFIIVALLLIGVGGLLYLGLMKGNADAERLASYVTADKGVRD